MPEQAAIQFQEVSKAFGPKRILDRVSFEIPSGRAFCLLGRSGTGKSVTLKLTIGLMQPDSGRVIIEGTDLGKLDSRGMSDARRKMGFLFQNAALFDSISVGENVAFPLRRHTKDSNEKIRDRVMEVLGMVGLERDYDTMPSDLSGGMRKRAGLARALAMNPRILLVDEPSAGLDPITSTGIDELLLSLKTRQGTTMIVVTHNIPSARRIADELGVIHEGQLIERGPAEQLESSEHEMVREFMASEAGG
jgi:phospholipid/cholesterol/gamma-HCH transport system ATP-binding protein